MRTPEILEAQRVSISATVYPKEGVESYILLHIILLDQRACSE